MDLHLFDYFRSSAAYRVRIALNLKGLEAERSYVNLSKGEQGAADFRKVSPTALVPVLDADGHRLHQSLAMIEYLDETRPEPPLMPADPAGRARGRGLALAMATDIHPLGNLRVLNYVENELGAGKDGRLKWLTHWCHVGLEALEVRLAAEPETGRFCHGDSPTLADICLVPQVFYTRRFDLDLSAYPTVLRIDEACNALPAFADAAPGRQPDAA